LFRDLSSLSATLRSHRPGPAYLTAVDRKLVHWV
jgi:hypothetical protein